MRMIAMLTKGFKVEPRSHLVSKKQQRKNKNSSNNNNNHKNWKPIERKRN